MEKLTWRTAGNVTVVLGETSGFEPVCIAFQPRHVVVETKSDVVIKTDCYLDEFATRQEAQVDFFFQSVHMTEHIIAEGPD
jgi:hypothetical protein